MISLERLQKFPQNLGKFEFCWNEGNKTALLAVQIRINIRIKQQSELSLTQPGSFQQVHCYQISSCTNGLPSSFGRRNVFASITTKKQGESILFNKKKVIEFFNISESSLSAFKMEGNQTKTCIPFSFANFHKSKLNIQTIDKETKKKK